MNDRSGSRWVTEPTEEERRWRASWLGGLDAAGCWSSWWWDAWEDMEEERRLPHDE